MASTVAYAALSGSEHAKPRGHKDLGDCKPGQEISVTVVLRRRRGGASAKPPARSAAAFPQISRARFLRTLGSHAEDMRAVSAFAKAHGLSVIESHPARRSVRLRGTIAAINAAFRVRLRDFQGPRGRYRSHKGRAFLPKSLATGIVQAVLGLDTRPVPAKHYAKHYAKRTASRADPPNTRGLTPQQAAALYEFPSGDGAGQTIGIYEMATSEGPPGYAMADVTATMRAFGGDLAVPKPIDVSIDGTENSGQSDPETLLDITVSGAIAQRAKIAVYFTGESTENITHALQRMIHPGAGDPVPTILSISYGWGLDDGSPDNLTAQEIAVIDDLFQDAATLGISVLVSSGDSGAKVESNTQAQTSFPATDPWVLACGGSTIGEVSGPSFDEYVWNDTFGQNSGATGGGISPHFPVPSYQAPLEPPKNIVSGRPGRGIPDVAGNASPNSGYPQVIAGEGSENGGGTSAVAPLYAGLLARINANLGRSVGFINPQLYQYAGSLCRDIAGPPGPTNNSYDRVKGYPAGVGWNACTGFGSLKGTALQSVLATAARSGAPQVAVTRKRTTKVFHSGTFAGVPVTDAFARAAAEEKPVEMSLSGIPWPRGLQPQVVPLGRYRRGTAITGPLSLTTKVDALIVLYTDPETSALLEVFTGDASWTAARKRTWCGYGHQFAKFAPIIEGIPGNAALKQGLFGYLSAVRIGRKYVLLYKSELHPKQNGNKLPFIPVMQQLISEVTPGLVISTGTAGAIGSALRCGDVAICKAARFHCQMSYPTEPQINVMSASHAPLVSTASIDARYVRYAAASLTKLSLPGLAKCHANLERERGYAFVKPPSAAPAIYAAGLNAVPAPQPMAVVSADYLTVDDDHNSEGLQALGTMNETDDAFLFYGIARLSGAKPQWLSIRNASEPQIVAKPFPPGTPQASIVSKLKGIAGPIYGIYQYCTTLNSAFACWAVIAGA
ncbi:MAG TPA: protease pro-enzyme activation domain-containing protein [Steroidobacteraceae bacterium]|nr:protease pro-enzyme activation domain-containing protein [Steroidobacteraceae bacterium]